MVNFFKNVLAYSQAIVHTFAKVIFGCLMSKKGIFFSKVCCRINFALLCYSYALCVFAEDVAESVKIVSDPIEKKIEKSEISNESSKCAPDYFVNFTYQHVRENNYCWGPKNYSAFGVTPVVNFGNFSLCADQIFGRSEAFIGPLANNSPLAELESKLHKTVLRSNLQKKDVKRGWSKLSYDNSKSGYVVSCGDVVPRLTFGPMQGIPGAGISIYRSNYSDNTKKLVINAQTPIIIHYPSKIEIKKNGSTIQTTFLESGIYSIFNLAPEARVWDGCEVKISDHINRSYTFVVDMHADKKPVKSGDYAFEFYAAAPRKFYSLDPYRNNHEHEVTMNAAIKRGLSDNITMSAAMQTYKKNLIALFGASVDTNIGLINNSVGFSSNSDEREFKNGLATRNGATYEFYFRPKETPLGSFDIFVNTASKGYSKLGRNYVNAYECLIANAQSLGVAQADIDKVLAGVCSESRKIRLNIRYLPVRIFENLVIGLAYDAVWLDSVKTRSYDICFDFVASNKLNIAFGFGLTKRGGIQEQDKVAYLRNLVRRLYIALCYKVTDEIEFSNSYDYDAERISWYCLNYKPKKIKGLELEFSPTLYNGAHKRKAIAWKFQYKRDWLDIRVDQSILQRTTNYSSYGHTNKQRILFNTCFSNGKFSAFKKTHYLVDHAKSHSK